MASPTDGNPAGPASPGTGPAPAAALQLVLTVDVVSVSPGDARS